jgi:LPS-assembly protein
MDDLMMRLNHIDCAATRALTPARISHVWTRSRLVNLFASLALTFFLALPALTPLSPAVAQSQFNLAGQPKNSPATSSLPMLLQADQMIYDNQNNRVIAQGKVEIYYNDYTLLADKVIYERANNVLKAEGNVRIKEPKGALIKTNRITLTDDFRDGFIQSLKIVTEDDARIAAARAVREKGDTTVFERAVYTPCKPCEENPDKPPSWRIKAKKIIHKKSEATISYRDAVFEMFGWPVLKLPYFKHADPSVKRKSGFLLPRFGSSTDLGTFVETPYYWALAPNYDFTFSPRYTSKRGVLLKGQWRHRLQNGKYVVNIAGIDQTDNPSSIPTYPPSDDEFRGSVDTKGDFAINRYWGWGWDVTVESDDTFRRFYDIDNIFATDRIDQIYLVGQRDRNYFDARLYHFGGLTFEDTQNPESSVYPSIDYNYIFSDPVLGGELSFDSNVMSLTRGDGGTDSSRLITEVKWRRQFIDRRGQVITPFANARGDVYDVSSYNDPVTGSPYNNQTVLRGIAAGGIEYRYPFVQHTQNGAHIFEPIAQIIARPDASHQFEVPNEDAQSLVFDDTLLFDIDKFSGYDRMESGTRANVGLRYTLQKYDGGYVRMVVGQSYQIAGRNDFAAGTGLEYDSSDYVAGLYVQPMQYFSVVGQGRFDKDDFSLRRTDLSANVNYGPVSGSVVYVNLDPQPGLGITAQREEVYAAGSLQLARYWSVFGHMRYNLEESQQLTDGLGIKYSDDCFALSVSYEETFIRDRDIQPNESVMVRFEFKNLGAFDVDAL